jgi:hypothetical protein
MSWRIMKQDLSEPILHYTGARSSTAKIGNVTAKSSSTSIFLESTKVDVCFERICLDI